MEEIVHIVPLGWEIDRATEPIKKMKAHRVYLLYRDDHELIPHFIGEVKENLKAEKVEVIDVTVDGKREFEEVLLHVSRIIVNEATNHSRIHINISASGKIDAAAASLAGMYHSDKIGSLYYVVPSSYSVEEEEPKKSFMEHGLSVGMKDIYNPPNFEIKRPKPESLFVLTYLYENGPQTYKSIINALKKADYEPFNMMDIPEGSSPEMKRNAKKEINKWTMKLRRLILEGLVDEGYVQLKPSYHGKRTLVDLTKNGEYAAILSGKVSKLK